MNNIQNYKIYKIKVSETSPAKETESMETSNTDDVEPARLPRPKHLEAQLRRQSDENEEEKKTVLGTYFCI